MLRMPDSAWPCLEVLLAQGKAGKELSPPLAPRHPLTWCCQAGRVGTTELDLSTYQGVSVIEHDLACRLAPRIGHVGIGMVDGQGTQTWQGRNSR